MLIAGFLPDFNFRYCRSFFLICITFAFSIRIKDAFLRLSHTKGGIEMNTRYDLNMDVPPREALRLLDGIRYDSSRRVAFVGDTIVTLSATENTILTYLLDHPNTVMSRKALLKLIWNDTYDYPTRVIDIHISHLRKKLNLKNELVTVYKEGYMFRL